jgi:hypothetical protein
MSRSLLLEIARCPIVALRLSEPHERHPCQSIVATQSASTAESFQVPEPWSGSLSGAPILFLSSNPSIGDDVYPDRSWKDEVIVDFFERRFGGGQREWVIDGTRALLKNDTYNVRGTKYWQSVRQRARELLNREPIPGQDYVLSEVVHCKSEGKVGVAEAFATCVDRYLTRVLDEARAVLVVALGSWAAWALRQGLGMAPDESGNDNLLGPIDHHGRARYVAFLPHPNRIGRPKSFAANLTPQEMARLTALFQS